MSVAVEKRLDAAVDEDAQPGGFGAQLGELELRVLKVRDSLAERLTLTGIVDGPFDDGVDRAGAADRLDEPLLAKLAHQNAEARPFLAQQVSERSPHVVEEEFRRILGMKTDLLQKPAAFEAGLVRLDHDQ